MLHAHNTSDANRDRGRSFPPRDKLAFTSKPPLIVLSSIDYAVCQLLYSTKLEKNMEKMDRKTSPGGGRKGIEYQEMRYHRASDGSLDMYLFYVHDLVSHFCVTISYPQ